LRVPGAEIVEEVMVTVSWELLLTEVVRMAPLKTTTEEDTNWLPVAVRTKLDGNCEKTMVVGEIELRTGTGRALPQSGFSALQPGRSRSATSNELRRPIRREEGMKTPDLSVSVSRSSGLGKVLSQKKTRFPILTIREGNGCCCSKFRNRFC
jgi:hypothetical protein